MDQDDDEAGLRAQHAGARPGLRGIGAQGGDPGGDHGGPARGGAGRAEARWHHGGAFMYKGDRCVGVIGVELFSWSIYIHICSSRV